MKLKKDKHTSMSNAFVVGDELAFSISKILGKKYSKVEYRTFPDGEIQPRITKEFKGDAILAIRKLKDEKIDDYLIRFFLTARKLKEKKRKVLGIMPYFPYARQDKIFRKGETFSAKYIAELVESELDFFITINMHEHRKKINEIFKIKSWNISVFEEMGREFSRKGFSDSFVLGPDYESKNFARDFARGLGCKYSFFGKERDVSSGKIKIITKKLDVRNKDVIIVDDVASSGKTLIDSAITAKKQGAKSISFCFVHAILADKSSKNLLKLKPKIVFSTNSIQNDFQKFDIAKPIANHLKTQKIFK